LPVGLVDRSLEEVLIDKISTPGAHRVGPVFENVATSNPPSPGWTAPTEIALTVEPPRAW
jgi:hypothetical protein